MLMFLDMDSNTVKFLLFMAYLIFLLYAFNRGREWRLKKKEKNLRQRLYAILGIEELPIYKKENKVNWSKVYTMLKKVPDSPEKDQLIEIVKERKNKGGN